MLESIRQWLQTPPSVQRPLRRTFTLMYTTAIGLIVLYLNLLPGSQHPVARPIEMASFLAVLLGIEFLEQNLYGLHPPTGVGTMLLVVRFVVINLALGLDGSGVALFLTPILPFIAYFLYGSTVSNIVSWAYVGGIIWKTVVLAAPWYVQLLYYTIAVTLLLFMRTLAVVIHQDEQNREHTRRLLSDLAMSHQQLQEYAEEVADLAAAEERNRLARDIHDSLGHYLTVVNIQLEKALAFKDRDLVEAEKAIRDAKQAAKEALTDVRHSVSALRNIKERFSLRMALDELIEGMGDNTFALDYRFSGEESTYARTILMALYRAAQESLTNVQKHAHASQVVLDIQLGEQEAKLQVCDDGQGFEVTQLDQSAAAPYNSFGLQGIQERLELIGGEMLLDSSLGQGTRVLITIPRKFAG